MIDAEVEQRSVNADVGVDEIAAEERHIIAGTALTSVTYASYVINLTELAFSDHLLGDTGLRVVDGAVSSGDTDRENYRRIVWDGLYPSFENNLHYGY